MKTPRVSIIIVNWNGFLDTKECIESLQKINYKNIKIILVDNCVDINEGKKLKKLFENIILIQNGENFGFCKACNIGIQKAKKLNSDYVLLLNNDTVVTKDFLNILVKFYENHQNIGAVSPLIRFYKSDKIWYGGGILYRVLGIFGHKYKNQKYIKYSKINPYKTDYISGCCLLTNLKTINSVGLLDEDYFAYFEDTDWSFRTRKKNLDLYIVPQSLISHKKSASTGIIGKNEFSRQQIYLYARNIVIFSSKNFRGVYKYLFILQNIIFFTLVVFMRSPKLTLYFFNNIIINLFTKLVERKTK